MTEAEAIMQMPRTRERVYGELSTARDTLDAARKLLGECAAFDARPIVFVAGDLMPLRDYNIPDNIREFHREAAYAVAKLERELYDIHCATFPL